MQSLRSWFCNESTLIGGLWDAGWAVAALLVLQRSSYVQHGIWEALQRDPDHLFGSSRCAPGSVTFGLRATRNLGGTATEPDHLIGSSRYAPGSATFGVRRRDRIGLTLLFDGETDSFRE